MHILFQDHPNAIHYRASKPQLGAHFVCILSCKFQAEIFKLQQRMLPGPPLAVQLDSGTRLKVCMQTKLLTLPYISLCVKAAEVQMEFRATSVIGAVRRPGPPSCNRAAAALLSRLAKRPGSGRFNESAD